MFGRNYRLLRAGEGNLADERGCQYNSSKILNVSAGLPTKIRHQIKKVGQNRTLLIYQTKTCKERALKY